MTGLPDKSNPKDGPTQSAQVSASPSPIMWICEKHTPNDVYHHGANSLVFAQRTQYQDMIIADVGPYGRALFLDGALQTSEGDEAHYHEPIVHVPAIVHGSPSSVLILGGGDGGSAREALRWKSVTSVVNVDLDGAVVEACREYMPSLSQGAFDDPRCTVIIDDALHYLANCERTFDIIICDLTDPVEGGPSSPLFTQEFFTIVRSKISPQGALSLQSGTVSLVENPTTLPRIYNILSKVFPHVHIMQIFAPKYGSPLALCLASQQPLSLPPPKEIDQIFESQLSGHNRILDGRALHGLFAIPKNVSLAVQQDGTDYTTANQVRAAPQTTAPKSAVS